MDSQSRRVGRPRKNTLRIELRLNADDTAIKALIAEAEARHTSIQQHITDILTARYLNQPPPPPDDSPTEGGSSAALADEWM